jgi:hypothetical protein
MLSNKENKRRDFLKGFFSLAATFGIVSSVKGNSIAGKPEKIKMLTPDGKLVEVEKHKIEKEIVSQHASNKDVLNWLSSKKQ